MNPIPATRSNKVPEVVLAFWIIKIIATTLGETGGDAVSMSMGLGYAIGSVIFIALFVVTVVAQVRANSFHPLLYWSVIVATTTAGTTMADFADRSLGIGYPGGASILFALLIVSLAGWYWSVGSVSVENGGNLRCRCRRDGAVPRQDLADQAGSEAVEIEHRRQCLLRGITTWE